MFCRNTRSLWSQSSLYFPADESYYIKYIFDMQFPFLPVGLKWKVVKNVHCPLLLINTGLMSIGPLTKKLLQKHRLVSYSKNEENVHFPLTESSAEKRTVDIYNNNEWMMHLYRALLCIVVHPNRFTIMWGGGVSSTTTSMQHPLGWCDGCHKTTAPVRSPHTSYRWRGERVIEPIKWMRDY